MSAIIKPKMDARKGEICHCGGLMKVTKHQAAANRDALLDAAGRLFRERGIDDVGVAEIGKEAGLTHGALYAHFPTKDALAAEAYRRWRRTQPFPHDRFGGWGTSHLEQVFRLPALTQRPRRAGHGLPDDRIGERDRPSRRGAQRKLPGWCRSDGGRDRGRGGSCGAEG